ncbi:MAG: hypothetical protein NC429_05075 [Lachnospiraceae bacterium]|nr:hypothetical protein [Lachnospiraceae bacterium]
MNKLDIIEMHRNCLDFLLKWQLEHEKFYFVPRKKNNSGRLDKGMYFRGNDDYIVLTFWNMSDKVDQIYLINWDCNTSGEVSITLCCRNDPKKLPYILAIKDMIEDTGKKFEEFSPSTNKWKWYYPSDMSYIETLEDFVTHEKPMIDKYLLAHPESGIPLADVEIDNKYVKTLPGCYDHVADILIQKKTGVVEAVKAEYIMTLKHNELSNKMVKYLRSKGYKEVATDKDFVDIQAVDSQGNKVYFELKTADSVRLAIRQALGQLLEYNHYPNKKNADKLIIVTELEATQEDMQYLIGMRSRYNIPVYYQQFDMDKKSLSKEY